MPDAGSLLPLPGGLQPTDEFIVTRPGTPGVTVDIPGTALASTVVLTAQIGAVSGVAGLDSTGRVPLAQLPTAIASGMQYQGAWNATANSPTLVSGTGTAGFFYIVGTAGTTAIDGVSDWNVGDWIVFEGSRWQKIEGSPEVISVNTQKGVVVITAAGIGAEQTANKGQANGYAGLDGAGHVPANQLPTATPSVQGAVLLGASGGAAAYSDSRITGALQPSSIGTTVAGIDGSGALTPTTILATVPAQAAALAGQYQITFSSPTTGASVTRGQTITISWSGAGLPSNAGIGFYLTPSSGGARMYARFPRFTAAANRQTSFSWVVPSNITNPDGSVTALSPGNYQVHAEVYSPGNATRSDYNAEKNYFHVVSNQVMGPDGTPVQFIGTTGMDYLLGGISDLGTSNTIGMVGYNQLASFLSILTGLGRNIFRMGVGPAVMEFPGLVAKMDAVITAATALGVVVLLQNDGGTFDENIPWMAFLGARYKNNPFVWINPANEWGYNNFRHLSFSRGGLANLDTSNSGNTTMWQDQMVGYATTLREAGWVNPICVNAVNASRNVAASLPLMETGIDDPNMIMCVHVYPMGTYNGIYPITSDQAFPGSDATLLDSYWGSYLGTYPIMIDEFGNSSETYVQWSTGFINSYLNNALTSRGLVGCIGFEWYGGGGDTYAMRDASQNPTSWGTAFDNNITYPSKVRRPNMSAAPWLYPTLDTAYSTIGGGVSAVMAVG